MIVLDSNILIAAYGKHIPTVHLLQDLLKRSSAGISIVTATELYAGALPKERSKIKNTLSDFSIIPFDDIEIAALAADYKSSLGLKIPDAIIAATCEFHGSQFYTYDRDFKKLKKSWMHVLNFEG